MDKVLKQRLIGATILIALAVIFIPMLFDAPDEQRMSREMTLELPEPAGERPPVRRLPIGPDQARRLAPESTSEPARSDSEFDQIPEHPIAETQVEPRHQTPVEPDPDEQTFEYPVGEPIDIVAPTEIEPADVEPEVQEPESVAEATLPPPDIEPPSVESEGTGGWLVQVASFGSEATADEIIERLSDLGHVATSELFVRGDSSLHRVRTGPYGTRDDAERARGQIARTVAGINPVVIAGPAPPADNSEATSGFVVQVGSFASRSNAVRLLGQLDDHGFDAFIHEDLAGTRTIWRVRVGPVGSREDAVRKLAEITERAGLEGLVVSYP